MVSAALILGLTLRIACGKLTPQQIREVAPPISPALENKYYLVRRDSTVKQAFGWRSIFTAFHIGPSPVHDFAIVNMDESSGCLVDTLELCAPNIPEEHVSLASMTPALAVNSNVFIQNVHIWNNETELSASSNTLRSSYLSPMNHHISAGTSHDEHQPLGSDDAKLQPLPRKGHTKSRRGCYSCKKRRVKVHLTPIHKTEV